MPTGPTAQGFLLSTYFGGPRAAEAGKSREKLPPGNIALFAPAAYLCIPLLAPPFLCTLSLFSSLFIFPFNISFHPEALQTMLPA